MRPVTMEEKIYRVLGVRQYRKFLVWVKLRYDQWRGKQDTDNYFLRGSSIEDMRFLKSQLLKNAKIHSFGAVLCLPAHWQQDDSGLCFWPSWWGCTISTVFWCSG